MSVKDIKDRITSHEATFDGLADIKSSVVPDTAGIRGNIGSEQSEVSAGAGQSADVGNAGESGTAAGNADESGMATGAGINGVADTDVVTDTDTGADPEAYVVTQAQRDAATQGHDANIRAYRDWLATHPLESEEDRKKRERKEKARKLISAVGDGISAMSNIYFTSQYAPDMYTGRKSMADAAAAQIEKARAEREKNADQYMRFSLGLGKELGDRDKTLRELEAEMERQKIAAEEAARKRKEHEWLAALQPDKRREQKGKADKAENEADKVGYDAETSRVKSVYAPKQQEADLTVKRSQVGKNNAQAGAAGAQAGYYNTKTAGEVVGTFDGVVYYNKNDYCKAVNKAAREYNKNHKDAPVAVEWMKETAYGSEPNLYETYDVAARLEPLLREERRNKSTAAENSGKKKTGVKWK